MPTFLIYVKDVFNICFMILLMIICIYPFWYVICASFSKASLLMVLVLYPFL